MSPKWIAVAGALLARWESPWRLRRQGFRASSKNWPHRESLPAPRLVRHGVANHMYRPRLLAVAALAGAQPTPLASICAAPLNPRHRACSAAGLYAMTFLDDAWSKARRHHSLAASP